MNPRKESNQNVSKTPQPPKGSKVTPNEKKSKKQTPDKKRDPKRHSKKKKEQTKENELKKGKGNPKAPPRKKGNQNAHPRRSYKDAIAKSKTQLKTLHTMKLKMFFTENTYSDDRPSYYQGPWEIIKSGKSITKGNLVALKKNEIMPELTRQVQYFIENAM